MSKLKYTVLCANRFDHTQGACGLFDSQKEAGAFLCAWVRDEVTPEPYALKDDPENFETDDRIWSVVPITV